MIKMYDQEVVFKNYPNGELYIDLTESGLEWYAEAISVGADSDSFRRGAIKFKYEDESDLIKLMIAKNFFGKTAYLLCVYYMPYSRMDRSENGRPFTLKYIADFINAMEFEEVAIIEPHSDVTCQLINNSRQINVNEDLLPNVMTDVDFNPVEDYIVFPDMGSAKRYNKLQFDAEGYNTLFFEKDRDFNTGEIKGLIPIGECEGEGKRAIIYDDLSSFGGTFYHTSLALRKMGFKEIYLLVTHCENSIFQGKLLKEDSPIDRIYTTDSMLTKQSDWWNKKYEDKLKVYSIEEILGGTK